MPTEADPNEGIQKLVLLRRGVLLAAVASGRGMPVTEQSIEMLTGAHYVLDPAARKLDLAYLVERTLIVRDVVVVAGMEIDTWRLTANGQDVMDGKPWRGVQVSR